MPDQLHQRTARSGSTDEILGTHRVKRLATAAVIAAGHAFVQNIRRGHCELAGDSAPALRPEAAFTELARAI
jgi:hypothetical protein